MERNESGLPASPYDEGYSAFFRREHYNENPYKENTPCADQWDLGWGVADEDNEGVFNHAPEGFVTNGRA